MSQIASVEFPSRSSIPPMGDWLVNAHRQIRSAFANTINCMQRTLDCNWSIDA